MKRILFIILFFPALLKAQVPGYEGKHFIASYNLGLTPNLGYIYTQLSSSNTSPVQLFFTHSLNVEYVLGRRFSMGIEGTLLQNKLFLATGGQETINASMIGINFIFYPIKNNPIAPVGNFTKLHFFTGGFNVKGSLSNFNSNTGLDSLESGKTKGTIYGLGLGFGNNMIVNKNIVLTASINMDLTVPVNTDPDNINLMNGVITHMITDYLIYLKLGIGGLLF